MSGRTRRPDGRSDGREREGRQVWDTVQRRLSVDLRIIQPVLVDELENQVGDQHLAAPRHVRGTAVQPIALRFEHEAHRAADLHRAPDPARARHLTEQAGVRAAAAQLPQPR